jgi:hypothetical protein
MIPPFYMLAAAINTAPDSDALEILCSLSQMIGAKLTVEEMLLHRALKHI